jgi:hypothetical protein
MSICDSALAGAAAATARVDPNRYKAALDLIALNCRRRKLAPPGEQVARCNPVRACNCILSTNEWKSCSKAFDKK